MFQRLLESLAGTLERRGIRYTVIGGQAVLLYGEPRSTRGIDVTLDLEPERLSEILDLVKEQGWQVLVDSPFEFVQKTMILPVQDVRSQIRIDLVFSFSPYEKQAMHRVQRVRVGELEISYASVEDLIILKIVSGRPRDLDDIRGMLLKNRSLDLEYVRVWLREFDASLGGSFLEAFEQLRKSLPQI